MKHVVKRHGHKEIFDERKVYASVYAASLNAHHGERKAENIANKVTARTKQWIQSRKEVTSDEIRKNVKKEIDKLDKDVAMLYETIMDIC